MAKSRKDSRGYVLRTGESQRKDGRYSYSYTDLNRKRRTVYAKTLVELRTKYLPSAVNRAIERARVAYNKEEVNKAEKEDRELLIIPHFSAHNLRHTFCTRFCENESNLKIIQSIMGHTDIRTTMDVYAEATQEKKQEIVANLQGKIII